MPAVLPAPRRVDMGEGRVALPLRGRINEDASVGDEGRVLAGQIAGEIERATGMRWDIAQGGRWNGFVELRRDDGMAPQSYELTVSEQGVSIVGGGFEGVRNGVQTLRQIIRQSGASLPLLHIADRPDYAVRGYYLDVTRGRVPTLDWLKQWADELCLYKYNQLQLYVEHTFRFDGMSGTWRGTDALEPKDIIAFDDYCAARGIELVPSVSTFGHLYTALRSRDLRDLGEFPEDADRPFSFIERMAHHTLNIADPRALEFSLRLIDSYLELFRTKKFNICADETFDLGKGRSRAYAERVGVATMYARYVSALCRHLSERGHEPMLWGDIALEMPEILGQLPKDAILLNWLYAPDVGDDKVRQVGESGIRQYVCPAVWGWSNLAPRSKDAWSNISRLSECGLRYGAAGFLVTDWGDFGHVNDPRLVIPGMIQGAAAAWNLAGSGGRDGMDAVGRAIDAIEYGDADARYAETLAAVDDDATFRWYNLVQYLELDDGNGGLNHGVAELLYAGDERRTAWVRSGADLAQTRARLLTVLRDRIADMPRANDDLHALLLRLPRAKDASAATKILSPLLVAVHGQMLLNTAGWIFAVRAGAIDGPEPDGLANATAKELEVWAETYAAAWRDVSRESELRRVMRLIWRCADELRTEPGSQEARGDVSENAPANALADAQTITPEAAHDVE
ncbi:beta-N-acetylhexosaminidase [Bifidobacterium miconis]